MLMPRRPAICLFELPQTTRSKICRSRCDSRSMACPPACFSPRAVGGEKHVTTHAIERLSQRERQIFDLVVWGSSNKQIAGRLGISIKTVETHRGHINGKLRVHTSADIVRLASLWGMLVSAPAPTTVNGSNGTLTQ